MREEKYIGIGRYNGKMSQETLVSLGIIDGHLDSEE